MIKDKPKHDPRFNPIIKQFAKDAALFGVHVNPKLVKVSFRDVNQGPKLLGMLEIGGSVPNDSLGVCGIWKPKKKILKPLYRAAFGHYYDERYIFIAPSQEHTRFEDLETTVYHELGHCLLGKDHDENPEATIMGNYGGSLGVERFFDLKYFFTGDSSDKPSSYRVASEPRRGAELIFETHYQAFGKNIDYELYWNEEDQSYTVVQE